MLILPKDCHTFFNVATENLVMHQEYVIVVDFHPFHLLFSLQCTDMVFPLPLKEKQLCVIAVLKL